MFCLSSSNLALIASSVELKFLLLVRAADLYLGCEFCEVVRAVGVADFIGAVVIIFKLFAIFRLTSLESLSKFFAAQLSKKIPSRLGD